jgi:hypothetical protein
METIFLLLGNGPRRGFWERLENKELPKFRLKILGMIFE